MTQQKKADTPELVPPGQPAYNPGAVVQAPPTVSSEIYNSGELGRMIGPTSTLEQLGEYARVLHHDSGVGSYDTEGPLIREYVQSNMEAELDRAGVPRLKPDQLNKMFPGLNATEPMHAQRAQAIYDDKKRVEGWKTFIANGGEIGVVSNLATQLYAGVTDPINLAGSYGVGKVLGVAAKALAAPKIAESVMSVYLSNLAQNAATEYATANQLGLERGDKITNSEIWQNSSIGALAGTALHYGVFKPFIAGTRMATKGAATAAEKVSQSAFAEKLRSAVGFAEAGKNIETAVKAGDIAANEKLAGKLAPGASDPAYMFSELNNSDIASRDFYLSGSSETGVKTSGDYAPNSIRVGDNPYHANNLGDSAQGSLSVGKFLDLDQPAQSVEAKPIIEAIKKITGMDLAIPEGATLRTVLDNVKRAEGHAMPSDTLSKLLDTVKQSGYDAYKYVDSTDPANPHNVLDVFDEKKFSPKQEFSQNDAIVPKTTADERNALIDEMDKSESSIYHDQGTQDRINEYRKAKAVSEEEIPALHAEQQRAAEKTIKQTIESDPAIAEQYKAELDQIYADHDSDLHDAKLKKMVADCISKGII